MEEFNHAQAGLDKLFETLKHDRRKSEISTNKYAHMEGNRSERRQQEKNERRAANANKRKKVETPA